MIDKRYQLTFTDTTQILVDRLIAHGFNIRDILNAGVILFDRASLPDRGIAIAAAKTRQTEELKDAMNVICTVDIQLLDEEHAELVQDIRRKLAAAENEHPNHNPNKKIS